MANTPCVLLVQTSGGDTVAVRFSHIEAALDWEDVHESTLGAAVGCPRLVSASEALKMCGG